MNQNPTRRHLIKAAVASSESSRRSSTLFSLQIVQALRLAALIAHRSQQATTILLK